MRLGFLAWWFLGALSIGLAAPLLAQVAVPPNPGKATKRNLGDNGGSATAGASAVTPQLRTVVVSHLAMTPVETWTNLEGKSMQARLLAFASPPDGEAGPVEIVREGKVRFLVTGRKEPIDYALDQLGETERQKIEAIAKAAAGAASR